MKKRIAVALVALVMIFGCVVGGTLAWLVDKTETVTNTFTIGDINIELWENDYKQDSNSLDTATKVTTEADYKMVPGNTMPKNPTVTVKANSEACWLFVKVEKSANFDNFMNCSVVTGENGWTELTSAAGTNYKVYYREVDATTADTNFQVLAAIGDYSTGAVSVLNTVTKTMLTATDFTNPTLTFTAYAVQKANVADAATAWGYTQNSSNY